MTNSVDQAKIRVALVLNDFGVGGAERLVEQILTRIDKTRFECYLITLFDKAEPCRLPLEVMVRRFAFHGLTDAKSLRDLRRFLKEIKPDVIHCHLPNAVVAGGSTAAALRIPFIIHEHQTQRFHSWKLRLLYRLLRPFAALTICYADSVEEDIFGSSQTLSAPPEKITRRSYTILNGVDIQAIDFALSYTDRAAKRSELGLGVNDFVITSVARFVEWKGHKLLIEAFASVAPTVPDAKLLIAGDGPLLEELRAKVRDMRLESRVFMPGARSDVYEILAASDIFSLVFTYSTTMYGEAIGIAGFEAMAAKLPVIVGAYRNVDRYISDEKNGVIVQPRSSVALANAFLQLVRDPKLRSRIGMQARAFVERELDWSAIMPIYEAIYRLVAQV